MNELGIKLCPWKGKKRHLNSNQSIGIHIWENDVFYNLQTKSDLAWIKVQPWKEKKMQKRNGIHTSSLTWNDCNLERSADFTLGGSPWYRASRVLGGTEPDRDTWLN